MTELDVINDALSTMGEAPLNDIDEDHPFVPRIRSILVRESAKLQQESWWFNLEIVTLTPDTVSKFIYTPTDAIRCDPVNRNVYDMAVQRGRRLYDTNRNTYEFGTAVECFVVRNIPFEDLPLAAQHCVSAAVSLSFQSAYDADQQRLRQLTEMYRQSHAALRTEHIRNRKSNLLFKSSSLNELRKIGMGISSVRSFFN